MFLKKSKMLEEKTSELTKLVVELEARLIVLQKFNDKLFELLERSEKRVDSLQTALISKEAPAAFNDMVYTRDKSPTPNKEEMDLDNDIRKKWFQSIEAPLFDNVDDFVNSMSDSLSMAAGPVVSKPLDPTNSES